jgi:lysyl-tRNA synthetase class 2
MVKIKSAANNSWQLRAELKKSIRSFFGNRNYLEVDTPILVKTPGTEVHLEYFATEWLDHQNKPHPYYLRSSPELHLKKILASGEPRIFEFAKSFRNHGELSDWHQPEFTMLEWYETGISYSDFMTQTEDLLRFSAREMQSLFGIDLIPLKLPAKFDRITVAQAFKEFAGVDLQDGDQELASKAKANGILSVTSSDDFETAFFKTLLERIEPQLKKLDAVFLYNYPGSMAALAKVERGWAHRFECYVGGVELCNAFEELLGEKENRDRITASNRQRQILGKQAIPEDDSFYEALALGLPACCGNALGFDRWLTLLTGNAQISIHNPFAL